MSPEEEEEFAKERITDLKRLGVYDECAELVRKHGILSLKRVFARTRLQHVVSARGRVMLFLRERFTWSYPAIADFFGMDHTSVIAAVRKARGL
jgi:chromosomal replication initiation ATPase DnaA